MANKHRTALGKTIDMDALRLKNETAIAVGNMRVNARGDVLGTGGVVAKDRNQRMNEEYKLHTMVPKSSPVATSARQAAADERLAKTTLTQKPTRTAETVKVVDTVAPVGDPVPEATPATKPVRGNLAASVVDSESKPATKTTKSNLRRL